MATSLQVGAKLVSLAPRPLEPGEEEAVRAAACEQPALAEEDDHGPSVPDGHWVLRRALEKVVEAKHDGLLGIIESMFADMVGLEGRILRKVDESLAGMRQEFEETLEEAIFPMVRNIGDSQADLKTEIEEFRIAQKAEIDEISAAQREMKDEIAGLGLEAFESRADLMARIDDMSRELSQEAFESRSDLVAELEEVNQRISGLVDGRAADDLESLELQLEQELAARAEFDFHAAPQDDVGELQSDVRALGQRPPLAKDEHDAGPGSALDDVAAAVPREQAACDLDLSESAPPKAPQEYQRPEWLSASSWSLGDATSKNSFFGAPYSSKISVAAPPSYPFEKSVPLVPAFRAHRPRPSARVTNCHSMPLLAPLQ